MRHAHRRSARMDPPHVFIDALAVRHGNPSGVGNFLDHGVLLVREVVVLTSLCIYESENRGAGESENRRIGEPGNRRTGESENRGIGEPGIFFFDSPTHKITLRPPERRVGWCCRRACYSHIYRWFTLCVQSPSTCDDDVNLLGSGCWCKCNSLGADDFWTV